ncbi:hypothetical protein Aperf_G00000097306 [Anoplocephala perfoliata]
MTNDAGTQSESRHEQDLNLRGKPQWISSPFALTTGHRDTSASPTHSSVPTRVNTWTSSSMNTALKDIHACCWGRARRRLKSPASRAGFEPTRGNPNGFQVHRLNHSAIVTSPRLPRPNLHATVHHTLYCQLAANAAFCFLSLSLSTLLQATGIAIALNVTAALLSTSLIW